MLGQGKSHDFVVQYVHEGKQYTQKFGVNLHSNLFRPKLCDMFCWRPLTGLEHHFMVSWRLGSPILATIETWWRQVRIWAEAKGPWAYAAPNMEESAKRKKNLCMESQLAKKNNLFHR